jgi:Tfp pilus assembly protein PilF
MKRRRFIVFVALALLILPMAISCSRSGEGKQANACYERGLAYAASNDKDKALAEYTEAIRLDPTFTLAYSSRALLYERIGKHDLAIADYTEAITTSAEAHRYWRYFERGTSHAQHGEDDLAIADFSECIRIKPQDAMAYSERGKSYRRNGQKSQAIGDFTQAITLIPGTLAFVPRLELAYHDRGLAYADKGEEDRAIADFIEARGAGTFDGLLVLRFIWSQKMIQKELKLSDEQTKRVSDLSDNVCQKLLDLSKKRELEPSGRERKWQEWMKPVDEEINKTLAEVLTPDQQKRLRQLRMQWKGGDAFVYPEVQSALSLSVEQKQKIKSLVIDAAKTDSRRATAGPITALTLEKDEAIRRERIENATAVLTDEQKKTWMDLAGEPFDFLLKFRESARRAGKGR